MKPFDRYYTLFDGKDTIVELNPINGMYRVLMLKRRECFTCCKSIALSYIRSAEPKPAPALPQRISTVAEAVLGRGTDGTRNGKLSAFAHHAASALFFILMLALLYIVAEAILHVTH